MLCAHRLQRLVPVLRTLRYLSSPAESTFTVDKALLSKLRKKTGYPILNCRNALERFDNDIKEAEQWMKEQAQKEGWNKATKLQDRPMSQGLVGLVQDSNIIAMVEVNCETDFVARNEKFQELVTMVTEACHKNFSETDNARVDLGKEELNSMTDNGKTLADHVALTVGTLGENIALRRAAAFRNDPDTIMRCYTHAAGPAVVRGRCQLAKFAAIVKVTPPDVDSVATQLCQHIIGMKPKEIGEWEQPPPEKGEKKKKKEKKDEGPKEDESKLLEQECLLEPRFNVKGFLQHNAPRVVDFVRLECGEDLGEDD